MEQAVDALTRHGLFKGEKMMKSAEITNIVIKFVRMACYACGAGLAAVNLAAIAVTRQGHYYYQDVNQMWLAAGVGLIALGWILQDWRRA